MRRKAASTAMVVVEAKECVSLRASRYPVICTIVGCNCGRVNWRVWERIALAGRLL